MLDLASRVRWFGFCPWWFYGGFGEVRWRWGWRVRWILFESLLVSKSVEICRVLVCLVDLYCVSVHCFEVVFELRLFYRLLPCLLALSSSGL
ncbi:hypothetical protein L195_g059651 [Trifolium pratense]|uniref:Uncharacterized protein n=1 Tax=Trifolium pratense TaxID=57577 RepID=A0A2K3JZE5_TRIPR|nr:hypothetical protein L195_g059651 [Trifolium pratense]